MADCKFDIEFSGDASDLIEKAETLFHGVGGHFSGDTDTGVFSAQTPLGRVSGNYEIRPHRITILIRRKPFLMPCATIERYFRSYLAEQA